PAHAPDSARCRPLQQATSPVARHVAFFENAVAGRAVAARTSAPASAGGLDVVLDDAGGVEDSTGVSRLTVVAGGYPTASLDVRFTRATYPVAPTLTAAAIASPPMVSPDVVTADGDWTLTVSAAVPVVCDIDRVSLEL